VVKYTVEEKAKLVSEYTSSEMELRVWCKEKGLAYSTFMRWLKLYGIREPTPEEGMSKPAPLSRIPFQEQEQEEQKRKKQIAWAALDTKTGRATPKTTGPETISPGAQAKIKISRGGWAIDIESGFEAELLAEVMKVVDRVCC